MAKKQRLAFLSKIDLTDKKQAVGALFWGIALALIFSIFPTFFGWSAGWMYYLFFIVGIVIGILNIFHNEGLLFMLSGLTILLMLNMLIQLQLFFGNGVIPLKVMMSLLAPATLVVSLKVLYALAAK